jgi:hypothetical protein
MVVEIMGHDVSDSRCELLAKALAAGADGDTLVAIRDALRVTQSVTVKLPPHRFENLSRGRGWARKGRGDSATWGERVDGGYLVGPGKWVVGGHDGFTRKGQNEWTVTHVRVGDATWTIAN